MRKIILFLFLMQSLIIFGQNDQKIVPGGGDQIACISGALTINVGQTVNFSSIVTAQCPQCYDWDINGDSTSSDNSIVGNLQIVGSDMNSKVSIKGLSVGTGQICLTYFTESGAGSCCINVNIVDPPNCNAPTLSGWFECRGSGPRTGGQLIINNDSSVDWSKISSINIWLNGATFNAAPGGDTKVLTGPFTGAPGPYTITDSIPGDCYYGNSFGAIITVNYNNGCPSVQVGGNWYDYNTPPSVQPKNAISVYPNPTNSTIEFKGLNLDKYQISIYDISGNQIINRSKIDSKVNLTKQKSGIYIYKIEENGKVIQEGKITKK